jgi:hypothetical protein
VHIAPACAGSKEGSKCSTKDHILTKFLSFSVLYTVGFIEIVFLFSALAC